MTSSKIQKVKFFLFLLIFLLAQTAVSEGSFRERRNAAATVESKDKVEDTGGKVDEQPPPVAATVPSSDKNANGQQVAVGASVNTKTKPAADVSNRTHNITLKLPDVVTANKTAHAADASDEVRSVGGRDCTR